MNLDECFDEGLLQEDEPSEEKMQKSLENAHAYISDAEDNLNTGNHNVVLVCSYTAMFHAARSLLFKDGVKERNHVCLILYIRNKHPALNYYMDLMDMYRRNRHTAIYGLDYVVTETDAKNATEDAKNLLKEVERLVG